MRLMIDPMVELHPQTRMGVRSLCDQIADSYFVALMVTKRLRNSFEDGWVRYLPKEAKTDQLRTSVLLISTLPWSQSIFARLSLAVASSG